MSMQRILMIAGAFACAGSAAAQSFNIDFTRDGDAPSSAYAAAGVAGFWNAVDPPNFGASISISDLGGAPTSVTLQNLGGSELLTFLGPIADEGDARSLMNDCLITRSAGLESCIFFNGLEPGMYEVTIYAWMPSSPEILSWATVDEAPGTGQLVGGAWPGAQAQGVTYSRHTAEVLGDGLLRTHSGIAEGADPMLGAAMNGIQIRLLGGCPADFNGDGAVDSGDLAELLAGWGAAAFGPYDLDSDGFIGSGDLATLLAAWGPCE